MYGVYIKFQFIVEFALSINIKLEWNYDFSVKDVWC